jgi:hypothetical protein
MVVELVLGVLIVAGAVYTGLEWAREEHAALQASIKEAKNTLEQMHKETWGLELRSNEHERWIILPKGVQVKRTGELEDESGRVGVALK